MSPQQIGSDATPPIAGSDLPLIRTFSDISWISWAALISETSTSVKNIHYFMSLGISNRLTQRILSKCIRDVLPGSWGFPAWPGFEFETDSTQGQAILGTPNAQAFSYFLLQHKRELGHLVITRVRVFHDSNCIAKANLLFVVEAVEGGGGEEVEESVESVESEEAPIVGGMNPGRTFPRRWSSRAKL